MYSAPMRHILGETTLCKCNYYCSAVSCDSAVHFTVDFSLLFAPQKAAVPYVFYVRDVNMSFLGSDVPGHTHTLILTDSWRSPTMPMLNSWPSSD